MTGRDISFAEPDVVARRQRELWARQREYVMARSAYYRGWRLPERIEDLPTIGFTEKDALRRSQAEHPPFGSYVAAPVEKIVRLHRTSGTTGRAMNIAISAADAQVIAEIGGRAYAAGGLGPGMSIVHCLNYQLWMGGFTDHTTLEATGATVIPFGVGGTELLISTVRDLGVAAINCTVSYPAILAQHLAAKHPGLKPRDLGFRIGFLTGEAGLENPQVRARIEEEWGFKARNVYGISDALTVLAGECTHGHDMHFVGPDCVYPELVDPETSELRPWREGSSGELVLTHLERECQPLLRFRTGDVITLTGLERCGCGRTTPRFQVWGRRDDMLGIRGVNVFPGAVADVLNGFAELSGEFRIMLDGPPPWDRLPVEVELGAAAGDRADLVRRLEERLKHVLRVTAVVTLLEPQSLPRSEGKTKRVFRR